MEMEWIAQHDSQSYKWKQEQFVVCWDVALPIRPSCSVVWGQDTCSVHEGPRQTDHVDTAVKTSSQGESY